ncbi:MAG: DUF4149 domain-containing protein [Pseudomonadota bacterium]
MHLASSLIVGILLGGMVFFPAVVAPNVFRALEPEPAGRFLRTLFPAYYVFIIVCSLIAAATLYQQPTLAIGFGVVALTTLWVRQWLVPKINGYRDAQLAGDTAAGTQFANGHRLSVVINLLQMAFIGYAAVRLAL